MKKNNLCNKISNHSFDFSKFLKINTIIVASIILLSLLVTTIFGLNKSFSINGGYIVDVKFGTELTVEEYKDYKSDLANVIASVDKKAEYIIEEGTGYNNSFIVKIKKFSKLSSAEFSALNQEIINKITEKLNPSEIYDGFEVSDLVAASSALTSDQIIYGIVAILLITIALSIYNLIRSDKVTTIAILFGMIIDMLLYFAAIALFRIPVSSDIFMLIAIMGLYSFIVNNISFVNIRQQNVYELNKSKTNAQVVSNISKSGFKMKLIGFIILAIFGVSFIAFRTSETLLFGFSMMLIPLITSYTSMFVVLPSWASYYNKDVDKRLQQRIFNKDKVKKDEDEIIV